MLRWQEEGVPGELTRTLKIDYAVSGRSTVTQSVAGLDATLAIVISSTSCPSSNSVGPAPGPRHIRGVGELTLFE